MHNAKKIVVLIGEEIKGQVIPKFIVRRTMSWRWSEEALDNLRKFHPSDSDMENEIGGAIMEAMVDEFPLAAAEAVLKIVGGENPTPDKIKAFLASMKRLLTENMRARLGLLDMPEDIECLREDVRECETIKKSALSGNTALQMPKDVQEAAMKGEIKPLPDKLFMLGVSGVKPAEDDGPSEIDMYIQGYVKGE